MMTLLCLLAGAAFGAFTSLVNALSSPYTAIGSPLAGTIWGNGAEVLSLLCDAGWSWAALAVAAGWVARRPGPGALAGVLTLMAATGGYYLTDALAFGAGTGVVGWMVAAVPFGSLLGMAGATIRRPGVPGLLAALTVPAGAAAQMILLPPRPHLTVTPPIIVAESLVWAAAVLGAGWAAHRFRAGRRPGAVAPAPFR